MRRARETCSVAGCDREHHARDLCATHYAQFKRGYDFNRPIKVRVSQKAPECSEDGCCEPVKAKGLCKMHYQRLLRHGYVRDPSRRKPMPKRRIKDCHSYVTAKGLCHAHYIKHHKWHSRGVDADR